MKTLFITLALAFAASAFAEEKTVVFPSVYNYGSNVQVQVWNHTDRNVNCSGFVYLNYQSGVRDQEYYFDYVSARFTSYRTIWPRRTGDRILSVNHSISCF